MEVVDVVIGTGKEATWERWRDKCKQTARWERRRLAGMHSRKDIQGHLDAKIRSSMKYRQKARCNKGLEGNHWIQGLTSTTSRELLLSKRVVIEDNGVQNDCFTDTCVTWNCFSFIPCVMRKLSRHRMPIILQSELMSHRGQQMVLGRQ